METNENDIQVILNRMVTHIYILHEVSGLVISKIPHVQWLADANDFAKYEQI